MSKQLNQLNQYFPNIPAMLVDDADEVLAGGGPEETFTVHQHDPHEMPHRCLPKADGDPVNLTNPERMGW